MKGITFYLLFFLIVFCTIAFLLFSQKWAIEPESLRLVILCGLFGGIGGVTYCLRGVYLNACVYKSWDKIWLPWYFIRPIVSCICGVISLLFLKAGLIVLEAKPNVDATHLTFYALSFIAGLNVDNFIKKLEDIAQVTWGIKKSRTSEKEDTDVADKDS